jgi:hypothetical protein
VASVARRAIAIPAICVTAPQPEGSDSSPKNPAKRNESKLGRLAGCVRLPCWLSPNIQFPSLDVDLELTIPHLAVELCEPTTKGGKFVVREGLDPLLKIVDFVHAASVRSRSAVE